MPRQYPRPDRTEQRLADGTNPPAPPRPQPALATALGRTFWEHSVRPLSLDGITRLSTSPALTSSRREQTAPLTPPLGTRRATSRLPTCERA